MGFTKRSERKRCFSYRIQAIFFNISVSYAAWKLVKLSGPALSVFIMNFYFDLVICSFRFDSKNCLESIFLYNRVNLSFTLVFYWKCKIMSWINKAVSRIINNALYFYLRIVEDQRTKTKKVILKKNLMITFCKAVSAKCQQVLFISTSKIISE